MHLEDKQSLSMLMRAMYIAKWESDDENSHVMELAGSPLFAKLFCEVIDELSRLDANRPANEWDHWRALELRPDELERTRSRIARNARAWQSWTRAQKLQMLETLISPFRATPATLEDLLLEPRDPS